jgi:L-ascorbate metabolism protein UlaG (beta-lactamase superfamily)
MAPEEALRVSWVGHSTLLIEIEGLRFLTDPVFSQRASPFRWLGPRRFAPPAIAIDELPPIDAVVISHDHYDHLDMDSIVALDARGVDFIVPLGVGAHLEAWGVEEGRIHELDWWDEVAFEGLTVACLPARHFSGRTGLAGNGSLWASWALVGDEARVFFSGDTSLTPEFSEIGARYGPFDIALVEVAAYSPHWADYHLGPEQAVEAFRMLRGRLLVPIHWGTFDLGLHGWTEPVERLRVAARARGAHLVVPVPGGSVVPSSPETRAPWWPVVPWVGADITPIRSSGVLPLTLPATLRPLATSAEHKIPEIGFGDGQ